MFRGGRAGLAGQPGKHAGGAGKHAGSAGKHAGAAGANGGAAGAVGARGAGAGRAGPGTGRATASIAGNLTRDDPRTAEPSERAADLDHETAR